MNYLDEVSAQLLKKLGYYESDPEYQEWSKDVVDFARTKLLQSYKNGLVAGKGNSQRQRSSQNKNSKAVE